ncbi:MAG: hypothetical protein ACAH11_03965 [Sphingomonas sp.]
MKPRHLIILALILGALAGWCWRINAMDPGAQATGVLSILFLVLIAQLPAVWLRMRGANGLVVLLTAVAVPLIPIEILLAIGARVNEPAGGDLAGIEKLLMWLAVPFVFLPAFFVTMLAVISVKPLERD